MSYIYEYPMPAVTVDAILLRKAAPDMKILLIKRRNEPFKDLWALPGGFVEIDEELDDAVIRELQEETGVFHPALRQLFTIGTVGRDPRYRTISVIYYGWYDENHMSVSAGDDAADAQWFSTDDLPAMAFDHAQVILQALGLMKQQR
ncbi:MAG TPA: NUDIX hydrolase [Bacteroidales bacterium]|nr:NUDIX hydrolase [Bacteroidales bacterium]